MHQPPCVPAMDAQRHCSHQAAPWPGSTHDAARARRGCAMNMRRSARQPAAAHRQPSQPCGQCGICLDVLLDMPVPAVGKRTLQAQRRPFDLLTRLPILLAAAGKQQAPLLGGLKAAAPRTPSGGGGPRRRQLGHVMRTQRFCASCSPLPPSRLPPTQQKPLLSPPLAAGACPCPNPNPTARHTARLLRGGPRCAPACQA